MKISTFLVLEILTELGVAGIIILAAGVIQPGLDPAILIGLAVVLLAAVLFVRTYRNASRAKSRSRLE